MAGSRTTPALATMPTEILCMIGANLSDHEIKEWTLASKRFRDLFLPRLCKKLKFSGNMEQLTNHLHAYFANKTDPFRDLVHRHTRYVTCNVHSFDTISQMNTWILAYEIKAIPIGQFLVDTPKLHGVVFKIWLPNQKEEYKFHKFIRKGPDWPDPKHLYFKTYIEESTMGKIIRMFEPGTLNGISSPPGSSKEHYGELIRNGADLTSLRLDRQFFDDGGFFNTGHGVVLSLNDRLMDSISRYFTRLESLILCEKTHDPTATTFGGDSNRDRLLRIIDSIASTLYNMPRLRRFAFTLSAVRFGDHAINALTTQLLARLRNKALLPFEAQGLEGVYRLLITYFAAHAKSLEEVCITSRYPMFYRATFTDGVWKMSQESFDDHSENYLFPTVLDG